MPNARPPSLPRARPGSPRSPRALRLAVRCGLLLNIELKPTFEADPLLADRVLAEVAFMGLTNRVLVSSFDIAQLRHLRALSTDVAIGLLAESSRPDCLALMDALDADALNSNGDDPRCLDDLRAARASGRITFPWTCNDPPAMRALIDAGATGVITDYPNRFPGLPLTAR